ncbi:hypothetical protein JCM10207_001048 [Rhodosporidiobolus poonsookiae]
MLDRLPPELLLRTLDLVSSSTYNSCDIKQRTDTLARVALVCTATRRAAQELLPQVISTRPEPGSTDVPLLRHRLGDGTTVAERVRTLSLFRETWRHISCEQLVGCARLRYLCINYGAVDLAVLSLAPNLTGLALNHATILAGPTSFSFPALREFSLHDPVFRDYTRPELGRRTTFPALRALSLSEIVPEDLGEADLCQPWHADRDLVSLGHHTHLDYGSAAPQPPSKANVLLHLPLSGKIADPLNCTTPYPPNVQISLSPLADDVPLNITTASNMLYQVHSIPDCCVKNRPLRVLILPWWVRYAFSDKDYDDTPLLMLEAQCEAQGTALLWDEDEFPDDESRISRVFLEHRRVERARQSSKEGPTGE